MNETNNTKPVESVRLFTGKNSRWISYDEPRPDQGQNAEGVDPVIDPNRKLPDVNPPEQMGL